MSISIRNLRKIGLITGLITGLIFSSFARAEILAKCLNRQSTGDSRFELAFQRSAEGKGGKSFRVSDATLGIALSVPYHEEISSVSEFAAGSRMLRFHGYYRFPESQWNQPLEFLTIDPPVVEVILYKQDGQWRIGLSFYGGDYPSELDTWFSGCELSEDLLRQLPEPRNGKVIPSMKAGFSQIVPL